MDLDLNLFWYWCVNGDSSFLAQKWLHLWFDSDNQEYLLESTSNVFLLSCSLFYILLNRYLWKPESLIYLDSKTSAISKNFLTGNCKGLFTYGHFQYVSHLQIQKFGTIIAKYLTGRKQKTTKMDTWRKTIIITSLGVISGEFLVLFS